MTESNADATVLTSSPKQFPVRQGRDFNHQESVRSMQFKDCREGSSRQSCLCAIFAMLNSLKSWMEQNVNFPIWQYSCRHLKVVEVIEADIAQSLRRCTRSSIAGSFFGGFRTTA